MKQKTVLASALTLTIAIEVILMILVYNKVGAERLPTQVGRLTVQLILIYWIFSSSSNYGLFLLTAYHFIMGVIILNTPNAEELFGQIFCVYHILIGIIIYFHDWIEEKIRFNR